MWCLYNDHCLDIVMIIWSSINWPTVVFSPTVCYFSRKKPLVKPTAPGSLSHIFAFVVYFSFAFILRSIKLKIQKYLVVFYFICDLFIQSITTFSRPCNVSGVVTWKGLTTPFTRRVASGCYLCAGAVYVVLLGSPTGSITSVSSLREIPTVVVLHHPFLFGGIPT